MSHYEERLEHDIEAIRKQVAEMASLVESAVKNAMHALQKGNNELAAATVLGDHPINRMMRKIDAMCHKFIALHLPSAGHLRLISSVIRANIELERIGDYAVTIAREALQLPGPPTGSMAQELDRIGNETRTMLHQAIEAFNELNADKAATTSLMEEHMENDLDIVYAELMSKGEKKSVQNTLSIFAVFTQLKRVADQAKNLCEEAIFTATGETKAPKVYKILFIDRDNSCLSQMAAAIARKNFPNSGEYQSAGRDPAGKLNAALCEFLDRHGISCDGLIPGPVGMTPLELTHMHVIVSLEGPVSDYFEQVPFHTTPLQWDIGEVPDEKDADKLNKRFEKIYREIALQVRDLMETMRGEDAS